MSSSLLSVFCLSQCLSRSGFRSHTLPHLCSVLCLQCHFFYSLEISSVQGGRGYTRVRLSGGKTPWAQGDAGYHGLRSSPQSRNPGVLRDSFLPPAAKQAASVTLLSPGLSVTRPSSPLPAAAPGSSQGSSCLPHTPSSTRGRGRCLF